MKSLPSVKPLYFTLFITAIIILGLIVMRVLSRSQTPLEAFECWCRSETANGNMSNIASQAAAAAVNSKSVVQGRYVQVSSAVTQCMNWAEMQIYSTSGGSNVASGKTVMKSSGYNGDSFPGSNLVDNNLTNFAHTSCGDVPTMTVDLGASLPIFNIRLLNRTDCCQQRAVGLVVTIMDANKAVVFTSSKITDSQGNSVFNDAASNKLSYLQYDIFPPVAAIVPSRPVT